MFEWLTELAPDRIAQTYMWRWAFQHPYLYTFIKIGQPAVIAFALIAIVRKLKGRRHN